MSKNFLDKKSKLLLGLFVFSLIPVALAVARLSILIGFEPMPGPAAGFPTLFGMTAVTLYLVLIIRWYLFEEEDEKDEQ